MMIWSFIESTQTLNAWNWFLIWYWILFVDSVRLLFCLQAIDIFSYNYRERKKKELQLFVNGRCALRVIVPINRILSRNLRTALIKLLNCRQSQWLMLILQFEFFLVFCFFSPKFGSRWNFQKVNRAVPWPIMLRFICFTPISKCSCLVDDVNR